MFESAQIHSPLMTHLFSDLANKHLADKLQ